MQARPYTVTEWTVSSLDVVLGVIGGFVGLIWDVLGFSLGGYQAFKFNTALMAGLYTTTEGGED